MFQQLLTYLLPFGTKRRAIHATPVRLPVRGKYDSAQTTPDNRRHWAMADGLSAAAANSLAVRRVLRNRARYEYANNTYCKGIVDTIANDTVGTGPTLQVDTGDPDANTRIEKAFAAWATEIGLAAKLRTMRTARTRDGEAFAVFTTNSKLKSPIKLDIRLVEADQVTDQDEMANHADGIRFDEEGNPISYTIQPTHPGDGLSSSFSKVTPTPAASVIHWFKRERPGQVRGVPEITPALPLFAQLRRYTLAVVAAAETAADFAAIMYTDAPAAGEADEVDPFLPIEIEQRSMLTIPSGWKMAQLKAEQPTSSYAEFKKELINEIARCLNMPFNVAACNSSGYNYSSGRLDHQTYFKSNRIEQDDCEIVILDRIFAAWLEEAALVPGLLPAIPYGDWMDDHQWFWDGHEHVDPQKEAAAQDTRLNNNSTTLTDEYSRSGKDAYKQLRKRARELRWMADLEKEFGVKFPANAATTAPRSDDSEDANEDEESQLEKAA